MRRPHPFAPTLLGLLVVLGGVAGCATGYETPGVRIANVRVLSLGLTEGTAALELEIWNPNRRALRVEGVRYRMDVQGLREGVDEPDDEGWRLLGEGLHDTGVEIGGRDTTQVTVEVPFRYETVGATLRSLFRGEDVRYRLEGEVRMDGPVGEIRAPVRTSGSVRDLRPDL